MEPTAPKPGRGRARSRARFSSPGPFSRSSADTASEMTSSLASASSYSSSTTSSSSTPSDSTMAARMEKLQISSTAAEMGTTGFSRGGSSVRGAKHDSATGTKQEEIVRPQKEKQGKSGDPLKLRANYYELRGLPSCSLHQYVVRFNPEEDRTKARKKLFHLAMEKRQLGYMFDGMQLFIPKRLEEAGIPDKLEAAFDDKKDNPVEMTFEYVCAVEVGAPIYAQLYNILIKKFLFALDLQLMGRNFFDPKAAIKLPKERLQLWPGYVTSIRTHEDKVLLCVEVTHKVIRMDSVLDIIRGIQRSRDFGDDKRALKAAVNSDLKDSIVMTTYNNKTYHVDDINFDMSPLSTFEYKGTETSYKKYFEERYTYDSIDGEGKIHPVPIKIKDDTQPLIMSKIKTRDRHNKNLVVELATNLIPELCQSTGLTDAMRSNFTLMKELGKHLHQSPKERVAAIEGFMNRLRKNKSIIAELEKWGMQFGERLTDLTGRILPKENIVFASNNLQPVDAKGDFTLAFRNKKMLSAVNLDNWVILVPQRDSQGVVNLINTMKKVATPLSMTVSHPKQTMMLPDIRHPTYLRVIDEALAKYKDLQMLFVILPNNKLDLYAAVKKRLAVEVGVPSQCFLAKNVGSKGLMSIATKVVVQMNAKLGGEPWSVKLPLKNTMFVGFDVHKGGRGVIGAMVATFSPNFTRYYSTTSVYEKPDDMATNMKNDFTKCLRAYQEENNGDLPGMIIMYRDGVGEGQLRTVYSIELESIKDELTNVYSRQGLEVPSFTFIVVTKKINTRLFAKGNAGGYDNPPPGTVVDSVVTLPERLDFYLISCGARQGTVSPCSYNVLYDTSKLDADKLQLVTYKMCHMYFNWSGTIAVPAPCQYAHKLAFLTGMAYSGRANDKLSKLLHFL